MKSSALIIPKDSGSLSPCHDWMGHPALVPCFALRRPLAEETLFSLHLQWFAAEEEGRTEEPSERKLRKAREEGKVPKSGDITSALVMFFGLVMLVIMSGDILKITTDMLRYFLTEAVELNLHTFTALPAVGNYLLRLALPVMAVCFLAAFLGNVLQVGFLFSSKPITPDLSKIAPNFGKWVQKSFFSLEAFFNLSKSIVKIVIIVLLAYLNIRGKLPQLISIIKLTPLRGLSIIAGIAIQLMIEASILLLAFSVPDYLFQRRQHRQSLKMTKHEQKKEHKETEGDPLIKNRLRQRMQELLSTSMARQVPEADVVITNPTHFAVALKWDGETMLAPQLIAKGQDNLALRIKDIARENEVPIVENRPLARALYGDVEIGDEIPEEYWNLVSLVLAEIYRLDNRVMEG